MRLTPKTIRDAARLASCILLIGLAANTSIGDEPGGTGRLGRLFRFGGGGTNSVPATAPPGNNRDVAAMTRPVATVSPSTPPSTPDFSTREAGARIAPQPRVVKPPTDSDPLVTRVAICRSSDGSQFASFLQVFADGTVLDGSGVHRVGGDLMKPIVDALHQTELFRLKGHCGAPSTDFVESVQLVVYERSYGKLRAASFSYSGNPHGCDPSVHKLHAAIEALETKLNTAAPTVASAPTRVANPTGVPVLSLTPPSP